MGFLSRLFPLFSQEVELVACALLLHVKRPYGKKTAVIEIMNTQTFAELDRTIRQIMDYDGWDHCSAFFQGTPWESNCIAEVYPDNSGPGQNKKIGSLFLEPGQSLGYVYDLGDNISHIISVKGFSPPDPQKLYPIASLNIAPKRSRKNTNSSRRTRDS